MAFPKKTLSPLKNANVRLKERRAYVIPEIDSFTNYKLFVTTSAGPSSSANFSLSPGDTFFWISDPNEPGKANISIRDRNTGKWSFAKDDSASSLGLTGSNYKLGIDYRHSRSIDRWTLHLRAEDTVVDPATVVSRVDPVLNNPPGTTYPPGGSFIFHDELELVSTASKHLPGYAVVNGRPAIDFYPSGNWGCLTNENPPDLWDFTNTHAGVGTADEYVNWHIFMAFQINSLLPKDVVTESVPSEAQWIMYNDSIDGSFTGEHPSEHHMLLGIEGSLQRSLYHNRLFYFNTASFDDSLADEAYIGLQFVEGWLSVIRKTLTIGPVSMSQPHVLEIRSSGVPTEDGDTDNEVFMRLDNDASTEVSTGMNRVRETGTDLVLGGFVLTGSEGGDTGAEGSRKYDYSSDAYLFELAISNTEITSSTKLQNARNYFGNKFLS